jgi:3,4-dihydroxy-2-butanone 4-phosphate synthase
MSATLVDFQNNHHLMVTSIHNTEKVPQQDSFLFDSMEDALTTFSRGEFLVVMDDEGRENEGDLIIAASHCTTEKMAWMIKHTRYVILAFLPSPQNSLCRLCEQRICLYCSSSTTIRGVADPNDGLAERRSASDSLYCNCRL